MDNKLIEKALMDGQNRYSQLVEYLSDMILVHSEGKIIFVNPAGIRLLGAASENEITGRAFIDFVHPEMREGVRERFRHVIVDSRESKSYEDRLVCADGTERIIETVISPFIFQGEWALLIVGHDVTERKRSEEALRQSEERFKTMVQNLNGYIYSVFYEGGIAVYSYHSPRCTSITGYSPEEYASDPDLWIKMVHKDDSSRINDFFAELKGNTQQTNIEHRILHKNGSIRWISNTFTAQSDESGELTRLDGFILDITDRKRAEEELKKQYFLLQRLIDTIPNPVYYKDINDIFKGCNIAFENLIGRPRHEIIGKSIDEIPPVNTDYQYFRHYSAEDFAEPRVNMYEETFIYSNDEVHNVIVNEAAFYNADSTIAGTVGVIIDVTKLKRTQRELNSTLDQLKEIELIINKSQAIVFLWKASEGWPVEFVSDNIEQFGYRKEDLISNGLTYNDIIFHEDVERVMSEAQRYSQRRLPEFSQEYRIRTKNGNVRWVEDHIWIRRNNEGEITHYQGIVYDITNRKATEMQLRDSEERYRTLADNSYDLICEVNSDLTFLYVSPNSNELLGYNAEDMKTKNLLEFVHIDDVPMVIRELRKPSGRVILRLKHENGEWLWFESAGKKFTTSGNEIKGVIVSRDISERKKLEQQMVQTEKLMAIGEMSAMIAHEFRNALTSVKMIIQLLSESQNLSKHERGSFSVAINSIYHMENIVQQLLNFAHPAPVELQIDNLNSIIKSCIAFVQMQANKRGIKLLRELDPELPPIILHATSIKETIINLLLNAVQAFDGTDIDDREIRIMTKKIVLRETINDFDFGVKSKHLGIRRRNADAQEIILNKGTECAFIEISDNGCGIETDVASRIFEPFFTTKKQGSGLGLSVVKRTVNAHGGIIKVDSIKGKGTKFSMFLPLKI